MNLADLKKDYSVVFYSEIDGRQIPFRPLTWREFDAYNKTLNIGLVPQGKLEDEIFRLAILDPILIDEMYLTPAGLIPTIVSVILLVSGNTLQTEDDMNRLNNDIETMRRNVNGNVYEQFIMLICKAFPTYNPQMIEVLSFQEVLRLVIMAEQMLGLEEPINIQPQGKSKSLTDQIFEDKKHAQMVEHGRPSAVDIRDYLQEQEKDPMSIKMAKEIEARRAKKALGGF